MDKKVLKDKSFKTEVKKTKEYKYQDKVFASKEDVAKHLQASVEDVEYYIKKGKVKTA